MVGVDLRTVQELGGWQTLAMVERYAHLSLAHKAQAVERLVVLSATASIPSKLQQHVLSEGGSDVLLEAIV